MRNSLKLGILGCLVAAGAARGENVITMGYGEGGPGERDVQVIVTATNDEPIHGYSLAFTYPSDALTCTDFSAVGTHIQALVEPDFVESNLKQAGVGVLGVIFSFDTPISTAKTLEPSDPSGYPRIIARITFAVKSDAEGGAYALKLKDGVGTPVGFNRFTNAGKSIRPRLVDGSFTVYGGNVLLLETKPAIAGGTPSLPIFAYIQHPQPLAGFQIAITYEKFSLSLPDLDPNLPDIQNATFLPTSLGFELGSEKVELFNFEVNTNYSPTHAWAACAVLFDYLMPFDLQTLSPSTTSPPNQSVMKMTFRVEATADDAKQWQDITLFNANTPGLIDNRFIIEDRGVDPRLIHGKIYFSQGNLLGRIIDSTTTLGVQGAKVVTEPGSLETVTDVGGNFRFNGIPPGPYTLLVSKTTNPQTYYKIRHFKTAAGAEILVPGLNQDVNVGALPLYPIPEGEVDPGPPKPLLRAHVNEDAKVDLSDAIFILGYLFRGGAQPTCQLSADTNDDNKVDISDAIFMLQYLFGGGTRPADPFSLNSAEGCSDDPTPGSRLSCRESPCGE
jgi:hypothetical protein